MKKSLLACAAVFLAYTNLNAQQNTLPQNGKVGIGTTNPDYRLDVKGSVKIDSMLQVKDSILIHKDARIKKNLTVEKDVRFIGIENADNVANKNLLLIKPQW